jgi:hypothetical protein
MLSYIISIIPLYVHYAALMVPDMFKYPVLS